MIATLSHTGDSSWLFLSLYPLAYRLTRGAVSAAGYTGTLFDEFVGHTSTQSSLTIEDPGVIFF